MPHYYSAKQTSELRLSKIKAVLRKREFEFYVGSGVFSKKKVDKGSQVLINNAIVEENDRVLDLGCGYGPVGVVIATVFPKTKIVMSDVNKRAVRLAKMNVKAHKLDNVEVIVSDKFKKIEGKFDTILVNPPQTAGKQLCFEMIEKSKEFLKKTGTLQLVARHNKGGKTLSLKMQEVFGNVKDIAKKSGYRVYLTQHS